MMKSRTEYGQSFDVTPPIEVHHCEGENLARANCPKKTFRMPRERHTVDRVVAKLPKANVDFCKALTQFLGCNFDVDWGEGVVRFEPFE